MAAIEIPKQLKRLLEDSNLQGPIKILTDRAGEILADNKLAFFPDYTDHGLDHIECVLKSEVDLVPKQVWDDSKKDSDPRLLHDADAAVIIGATLLHDIAMHLRPAGFRDLVRKDSRFQPLPWFRENHEDHSADLAWHELWENYVREARRFSERDLTNIIGETSARDWKFESLPDDAGQWKTNHYLVVGEFIRRHHARLAHEIAIYGFPGVPVGSGEGHFPAMGKEQGHVLMQLADLIGLVARSHGTSLRVCKLYLDASPLYPETPKPMGTAVFYPMALLRVADYLQIDRQRAPAVLLQLRDPQSPISVREWKKHRAVQNIGPATNPRGKMVTVSTNLSLSIYLQLRNLLAGLQAEMDHSTAVLDEVYGARTELGLNKLNLAIRRVYSNLHSPIYRDSLPYVPNHTGFTADPNLLTLLVEPLYGTYPSVGVRELMQNAADAVSELKVWCEARNIKVETLDLPEQDGDVLIEFIKRENGSWFLRVCDRGIGMTADTIQNYFLRAGASFRRSSEWAKEFLDERGQPRVNRAGRFGIGVFAVFLLGPSFRLWTRHAGTDKSMGYTIEASENSQLIEISRVDGLCIGTTIEVEIDHDKLRILGLEGEEEEEESDYENLRNNIDWFCWDWPKLVKRVVRADKVNELDQKFFSPIRIGPPSPEWSVIHPKGFDAVYWTFEDAPRISCNGLRISNPGRLEYDFYDRFSWPPDIELAPPRIAIVDSGANLPVTTQRYELTQQSAPFIDDLARDVVLSFIAHALVCGPASRNEANSTPLRYPLSLKNFSEYNDNNYWHSEKPLSDGLLRWCSTAREMIPADPWLYSLLDSKSCLLWGVFLDGYSSHPEFFDRFSQSQPLTDGAVVRWNSVKTDPGDDEESRGFPAFIFAELAREGATALGYAESSRTLVSTTKRFEFPTNLTAEEEYSYEEHEPGSWHSRRLGIWREISKPSSSRRWMEITTSTMESSMPLEAVVRDLETRARRDHFSPDSIVFYAAELRIEQGSQAPKSLIARIWNECLGPKAIPFDSVARGALVAAGSGHPELKRHIDAWKEMKRTDSIWTKNPKERS